MEKGCDDRSVGDIEVRLSEESFHDKAISDIISHMLEFLKEKKRERERERSESSMKGFLPNFARKGERTKETKHPQVEHGRNRENSQNCFEERKKNEPKPTSRRVTRLSFCSNALTNEETFQLITA